MTRPNILRADTLDLQDQQSPTAAEHTKHPTQNGNAPHLAASVHQVLEERHSEEKSLQDAWDISANLDDQPTTSDAANANNAQEKNGEEGAGEGEGESDDDMMDRISSSPSIEDGGYKSRFYTPFASKLRLKTKKTWPSRSTSLSPSVAASTPTSTPTRSAALESFNQTSADLTPDSSPFLSTPQFMPLKSRLAGKEHSPLADVATHFDEEAEDTLASNPAAPWRILFTASKHHHHEEGRYDQEFEQALNRDYEVRSSTQGTGDDEDHRSDGASSTNIASYGIAEPTDLDASAEDQGFEERQARAMALWNRATASRPYPTISRLSAVDEDEDLSRHESPKSPIASPFRNHSFMRSTTHLPLSVHKRSPSLASDNSSLDLDEILLPIDDPLLDMPLSPTRSDASWESMPEVLSDSSDSEDSHTDTESGDDDSDAFLNLDPQFIDYGWACECLHEAEDIDFEFVYALHTFIATVEGQANATKGDTMVLLDDSNSYWWLVRVVKDSSIGYLPAEHIETPTERLARLNKHRNIDLSATMLSDNSEKSRNPLKKAMRRRNAKTVQFAAPTYVEASDYDYSTEDEDNLIEPAYGNAQQVEDTTQEDVETEAEKAKKAEVEHPEAERRSSTGSNRASFDREQAATAAQAMAEAGVTDGVHGPKTEAAPLKSKRTRNTDSFLKDDKLDTVRITLTPGLLREEQGRDAKSPSIDTTRSSSFEELKPASSPTEQVPGKKDDKKKKEEKPKKSGGMLSGLFKSKKKDKKSKDAANDADAEKVSTELQREGSQRTNSGLSGKLSPSPTDKTSALAPSALRHHEQEPISPQSARESSQDMGLTSFVAELEGSNVAYEMGSNSPENALKREVSEQPEERAVQSPPQLEKTSSISKPLATVQNAVAPITNMLHLGDKEGKPTKAKKSKQRVELDDFDSPVDDPTNPFEDQANEEKEGERLSESPIEIASHSTFMHGTEMVHIPEAYREEDAEEGDDEVEGPESLTSSPSIIEHPTEPSEDDSETAGEEDDDSTPTARSPPPLAPQEKAAMAAREMAPVGRRSPSTTATAPTRTAPSPHQPTRGLSTDSNTSKSSSSRRSPGSSRPSPTISQQSWSDDSLKAWLEDGGEVRDMLVLINDKSGVTPVPADHPLMVDLFSQERKGVQDMMGQLNGLLGTYLRRKGVNF